MWISTSSVAAVIGFILLVLRRNYCIGIICGALTAHYCYIIARKVEGPVDAWFESCCCSRKRLGEQRDSSSSLAKGNIS